VPDLRGFADSDKPFSGYEPKTIAQDMLELLAAEGVDRFHILSHDLGGPPSVALAYMAGDRARSPRSKRRSSGSISPATSIPACPTGIWACT
jgi:pimeloyl-ACP methyl ester carboxylesterase